MCSKLCYGHEIHLIHQLNVHYLFHLCHYFVTLFFYASLTTFFLFLVGLFCILNTVKLDALI